MKNPLHRLTIRGRLFAILVALMIPSCILAYELNLKLDESIEFSQKEADGARFLLPLVGLLNEIADLEMMQAVKATGDASMDADIAASISTIDGLVENMVALDKELGERLEFTPEGLKDHGQENVTVENLVSRWNAIKSAHEYSAEPYKAAVADLLNMIKHAGDTSNLILDGDLDTYYIVDTLFNVSPALLDSISAMKRDGFALLRATEGNLAAATTADWEKMAADLALLEGSYIPHMHASLTTALKEDANFNGVSESFQSNIKKALEEYETKGAATTSKLKALVHGENMQASAYVAMMDELHDASGTLAISSVEELGKMINVRIVALKDKRLEIMGISGLLIFASFLLFIVVGNSISGPIKSVQHSLERIAEGDTEFDIPVSDHKDEISRLYKSASHLRETVEDAYRLKLMVEDMPTAIMTVDVRDNLKINYLNKASQDLMSGLSSYLPISVDKMMGQSIDIFHKNPKHQRDLLANPNNLPHKARIKVGPESVSLYIGPIFNKKHEYIGAMLTWEKITERAQLADNFESSVKSVVTEVSASADQMRGNAERLSTLASETKMTSASVAAAATEAAQTATQVAAAAEELTAAIGEISAQVQKSSNVANQASSQAENINQSMHLLVDKSNRVGEVIQFITNIASQINLLALNATIESARAGEAGRGFAVVASEVKNLANQTAKATEEIVQQVQSMQEATQEAVGSVAQIINIISEISSATAGVAAAVEEQSAATNEISRNITHTASGTNDISRSIVLVEKGAEETGVSSRQVLDSAKSLSGQASTLSTKVDEFLQMVRKI